jgi:hypothetical protein
MRFILLLHVALVMKDVIHGLVVMPFHIFHLGDVFS